MRLLTARPYRHRAAVMCSVIPPLPNSRRSHDRYAPNNGALLNVFDYWRANLSHVSFTVIRYIR
ncbi:hypothetical protein PSP6_200128 [Paraburkholderia tropica]|nr:hypothetical protein PSP6_200128 [Paraburkholderia tropica]